jgi:hypothetical protein
MDIYGWERNDIALVVVGWYGRIMVASINQLKSHIELYKY